MFRDLRPFGRADRTDGSGRSGNVAWSGWYFARAAPGSMLKSCGFPHAGLDDLRNGSRHEARNHAHASDITGPEPPRLAQHAPRPFKPSPTRDGWCAVLRAGDEIEGGADAQHAGSIQLVEAPRREQFLPRRAQRDEAEPGARGTNAPDRRIGFAGIR